MFRLIFSIVASTLLASCSTQVVSLGFLVEGEPSLNAEESQALFEKFHGAIKSSGTPKYRGNEVARPNTFSYSVTAFAGGSNPDEDWVDIMSISYPGGGSFLIYIDRIASSRREFSYHFIQDFIQKMELIFSTVAEQKVVVRSITLQ